MVDSQLIVQDKIMIRILIADDHAIVREGLKQVVSRTSDLTLADEASTGEEALQKALTKDYDVVVLDISFPDRNGLEILKDIKAEKPDLPILILSIHPEEEVAVRALQTGASGYLTKETASDELVAAIRKVSSGGEYVTISLAERIASMLRSGTAGPLHETLSDREFEVMRGIAAGKTVKEIAGQMFLSPNTVRTYRNRVLEKMGMKTNADIMRYAIEHKLML
jgi:two-component system invasion response regulator UvrY